MRRSIAVIALLVAACGGGSPSPSSPPASAGMAELWCPAAHLAECKAMIDQVSKVSLPSAVCVWPPDRWSIVTPAKGDTPGSACGADGLGTIRGIIVAP